MLMYVKGQLPTINEMDRPTMTHESDIIELEEKIEVLAKVASFTATDREAVRKAGWEKGINE